MRMPSQTYHDHGDGGTWGHVLFVGFLILLFVTFLGGVIYMAWKSENASEEKKAKRHAFMSRCIASHTEARCLELLRWGREDLVP